MLLGDLNMTENTICKLRENCFQSEMASCPLTQDTFVSAYRYFACYKVGIGMLPGRRLNVLQCSGSFHSNEQSGSKYQQCQDDETILRKLGVLVDEKKLR